MKLIPRHNQIVGRVVIERPQSSIIRPDATKNTTKIILVDAVGEGAAKSGIKVGDLVVPMKMNHFMLDGGAIFRPLIEEGDAGFFVTEAEELYVQTDNGQEYVPLDSERAAKSLGAPPRRQTNGAEQLPVVGAPV